MPLKSLSDISPGMIVEADVTARNGRLLLSSGQAVSNEHIAALMTWGVDEVPVMNGSVPPGSQSRFGNRGIIASIKDVEPFSFDFLTEDSPGKTNLTSLARKLPDRPLDSDPEQKIKYFKKYSEFSLFALEQAAALGDFHSSLTRKDDAGRVLKETSKRLEGLVNFWKSAFFIMNENTSSFELALSRPDDDYALFDDLLKELIAKGHIASLIWKQMPVMAGLATEESKCLIHLISTTSRVRGLFMGVLRRKDHHIPPQAMALLSNVLQNTANALESSQLYSIITRHNVELQARVEEKTAELKNTIQDLEKEISYRKTTQENLAFIFNNVLDAIFIYRPDGSIIDVNEKMLTMFGITKDQALALNVPGDITCHRRAEDDYFETWNEVFERGGKVFEWTVQHPAKDLVFPVEVYLKKIIWNDQPAVLTTLRDISQRKEAEKQLEFLAMHDPLTELPNRKFFMQKVERAIVLARRSSRQAAVLFMDLDGFKPVNDTYGHAVGDAALKAVAQRLRTVLRKTDVVARLGGDEFGIVIPDLNSEKDHIKIIKKVQLEICRPLQLSGFEIKLDSSIGAAVFPEDGQDVDTLIKVADTEMYKVKRGKKG